jgi:hypothetical protein
LLEQAGYTYRFDRMVYVNPTTKKVFSVEFVEDNNECELQKCIREDGGGSKWRFYFNTPPSETVKRELESVLR